MTVIGITGRRRHGKDSVGKHMAAKWGFTTVELPAPLTEELCIINPWCEITSPQARFDLPRFMRFADLVAKIGIDKAKDASADVRPYQQRYGTDIVRDRIDVDRWCKLAAAKMREIVAADLDKEHRFVLPNIRADNELALCDVLIRVVRPDYDETLDGNTHVIESRIDLLPADYVVVNDGTLADLKVKVDAVMERLLPVLAVPPHLERHH